MKDYTQLAEELAAARTAEKAAKQRAEELAAEIWQLYDSQELDQGDLIPCGMNSYLGPTYSIRTTYPSVSELLKGPLLEESVKETLRGLEKQSEIRKLEFKELKENGKP
jgi:hypothetical protein